MRGALLLVVACAAAGVRAQAPLRVAVDAAGAPRGLPAAVCAEAGAIWQRADLAIECGPDAGGADVRVVFDDPASVDDGHVLTLGWVVFVAGEPEPVVHLSIANTRRLLDASFAVVAETAAVKKWQRDVLVARGLGRALAHELGHVLLGTSQHDRRGLMTARQTAAHLFEPARSPFAIDARTRAAAAQRAAALIARR